MGFRIAIGECNCRRPYTNPIQRKACEMIEAQVLHWSGRLPGDLSSIPTELFETAEVDGHWITLGTHKHVLDGGRILVVFEAFVHTWLRPTVLSIGRVGRLYAEGLVVSAAGAVEPAPNEMMWEFT
ncbi:MAG: hypothetical protein ACR2L2_11915 [Acidobacteriota bacterium]